MRAMGESFGTRRFASRNPDVGTRMGDLDDDALAAVLQRAQDLGFIGGELASHLEHAEGFAAAIAAFDGVGLDLGTGGGLPGLVLAARFPHATWVLLDANERRTAFLHDVVAELGWSDRVRVVRARAEDAARDADLRGTCDLVVARSFGPPAVVAECAAGFLRVGGSLLVSEPPDAAGERWAHDEELRALGLVRQPRSTSGYQALQQVEPCPDRYPRRSGIPAKRPLF
jgi:16S rRNA (guanine527-N7)-methyltransferase